MKRIYGLVIFFIVSQSIFASNLSFLNYSAITYFTGQDEAMMQANVIRALNQYPDGKKSSWKNPKTGAWGFAIPSGTTTRNSIVCRNLKVFNNADNVTGESNYRMCKYGKRWKFVSN